MSTPTAQTPTGQEEHRSLPCMEIWGGSQAFDNAIAVPDIASWVYSRPHGGGTPGGDVHYVSMCACGEIARFFLADISGHGADALQMERPVPVIAQAVIQLLASRDAARDGARAIAMMRHGFGGHPFGEDESIARERREGRVGPIWREV